MASIFLPPNPVKRVFQHLQAFQMVTGQPILGYGVEEYDIKSDTLLMGGSLI